MEIPETIVVNGAEYVLKNSAIVEPVDWTKEPLVIVMNDDRGLCLVGNVNLTKNQGPDDLVEVKNARCIIRWGTTEHLAELAEKGPLENTRLGYQKTQYLQRRHLGYVVPCNHENWTAK